MKIKLKGIPLRIVPWSETSQIVTLLTDKLGKVSGVAKGTYRSRSSFDGPFDHLSHYQVIWFRSPQARLGQYTESYLYSCPPVFRQQLKTQYWALSCIETTREMLEEEDPTDLYFELRFALGRLVQKENPQQVHNDYYLRLLKLQGFGPVTNYCVAHGLERKNRGSVSFSSRLGGVLCPNCISQDQKSHTLNQNIIDRIEQIQSNSQSQVILSEKDEKKLTKILMEMVQHIIGKPLRMARYCSSLVFFFFLFFLSSCGDRDKTPAQTFDEAVTLLEENAWIRSSWRVDTLEDEHPENPLTPEVLWLTAIDQVRRKEEKDARQTLGRLLTRYPDYVNFHRAFHLKADLLKKHFAERADEEEGRVVYSVSSSTLDELEDMVEMMPYSPITDEILLLVADTYLGRQDYEEAELLYREILARVDRDSPLEVQAQYRLALSLWDRAVIRIRGFFDRHLRNPTEPLAEDDRRIAARFSDKYPIEASREFSEVIRRFPNSPEAELSRKILTEIKQLQAVRLLSLGDFYRFYGKIDSARHYYQRVSWEYPETNAVEQAHKILDQMIE